jgi:lipopolysaccharide biosynthesis regulator YciM
MAYEDIGRQDEGKESIRRYFSGNPTPEFAEIIFGILGQKEAMLLTGDIIRNQLATSKSPFWATFLFSDLRPLLSGESAQVFSLIEESLSVHMAKLFYVCQDCGFKAKAFHWQCPACSNWQTFHPNKSISDGGHC